MNNESFENQNQKKFFWIRFSRQNQCYWNWFLKPTRKAAGFKYLQVNCWEFNQVTWKYQMDFLNKTCRSRTERERHYWILLIRISLSTKFQLKMTIFISLDQIYSKGKSLVKNEKSEHHHWILHLWISLVTKFHFKQTIVNFGTKFTQGYFWSKMEKVNITIQFCIFKLVEVPNYRLKLQFWFFGPNLPERVISGLKQKNWTLPLN